MILANVSVLSKPQKLRAIILRTGQYIRTMQSLGKPVERVTLSVADYDGLLRAVNSGVDAKDQFDGIRFEDVVLVRRGS